MHRHQLDGGHAEPAQVIDDRRVGHPGVGAALVFRHLGVPLGQPLDVRLVDDAVHVGDPRRPVAGPVEERVDHDAVHHVRRGVVVVDRVGVAADLVGEQCRVPVDGRRPRPSRTGRAATCSGCTAGPGAGRTDRAPGSRSAGPAGRPADSSARRTRPPPAWRPWSRVPVVGEQTQLDLLGHLAEQREVGSGPVVGGAQAGTPGPARSPCGLPSATSGRQRAGSRSPSFVSSIDRGVVPRGPSTLTTAPARRPGVRRGVAAADYPRWCAGPSHLPPRARDHPGRPWGVPVPRSVRHGHLRRQGQEPAVPAEFLLRRRRVACTRGPRRWSPRPAGSSGPWSAPRSRHSSWNTTGSRSSTPGSTSATGTTSPTRNWPSR